MYNQDNITKAWFFASRVHNGQLYPGEKLPYLTHLGNVMMEVMAVASSLEDAELAIICAILHDSIDEIDYNIYYSLHYLKRFDLHIPELYYQDRKSVV